MFGSVMVWRSWQDPVLFMVLLLYLDVLGIYRVIRNYRQVVIFVAALGDMGTAVAQWLRCCATNRKVVGSIPDGFIGIFH